VAIASAAVLNINATPVLIETLSASVRPFLDDARILLSEAARARRAARAAPAAASAVAAPPPLGTPPPRDGASPTPIAALLRSDPQLSGKMAPRAGCVYFVRNRTGVSATVLVGLGSRRALVHVESGRDAPILFDWVSPHARRPRFSSSHPARLLAFPRLRYRQQSWPEAAKPSDRRVLCIPRSTFSRGTVLVVEVACEPHHSRSLTGPIFESRIHSPGNTGGEERGGEAS